MGWHSASWSSGKLPRSGGMGLLNFDPPPGPPRVVMMAVVLLSEVFSTLGDEVHDDDVFGEGVAVVDVSLQCSSAAMTIGWGRSGAKGGARPGRRKERQAGRRCFSCASPLLGFSLHPQTASSPVRRLRLAAGRQMDVQRLQGAREAAPQAPACIIPGACGIDDMLLYS